MFETAAAAAAAAAAGQVVTVRGVLKGVVVVVVDVLSSSVMASSSLAEVRSSQVGMKLEGTSRRRIRGSEMAVTVIPRGAAARSARGKRSRRRRRPRGSSRYAPLPGKSINVLAVTTTHTMSKLRAIAMLPVSSEGGSR